MAGPEFRLTAIRLEWWLSGVSGSERRLDYLPAGRELAAELFSVKFCDGYCVALSHVFERTLITVLEDGEQVLRLERYCEPMRLRVQP